MTTAISTQTNFSPRVTATLHRAVKVCGMCRPDNIARVAALRPDMMGFIFWQPSRRCALGLNPDVVNGLSEDILRVGVFVDEATGVIADTVRRYGLHMVQLHGSESSAVCATLRSEGVMVAKAIGIADADDLLRASDYQDCTDLLIFDTKSPQYGGTGVAYDRSILAHYTGTLPFLLSGGVSAGDAGSIASMHLPLMAGVDINSRFELSPGVKDVAAVAKFISQYKDISTHSTPINNYK